MKESVSQSAKREQKADEETRQVHHCGQVAELASQRDSYNCHCRDEDCGAFMKNRLDVDALAPTAAVLSTSTFDLLR